MWNPDPIFVRHIAPRNLFSFGVSNPGLELRALNLVIGPNASGKSNLIEAVDVMRSTPRDVRDVIMRGGGVEAWTGRWAGGAPATLDWTVKFARHGTLLRHVLSFGASPHSFTLDDERIEEPMPRTPGAQDVYFYYRYQQGKPAVNVANSGFRALEKETVQGDRSILAQRRDPEAYPELTFLADEYGKIRIYREWSFGRNTIFRQPQRADLRNDYLEEDFSNLGLFLSRIKIKSRKAHESIVAGLRDLYDGFSDYDIAIEGGSVQVFFIEHGQSFPATRLSDGSMRYLCLLAILCNPEPPPLICLEEPELGLHPDVLPNLARLLREASRRTQLIVTTHSDILVDAMTEDPESVVVCSKTDGLTNLTRLSSANLAEWLEKYRLGQLWTMGEVGGTRW